MRIFYLFILIFEQFIAYIYFNGKFERRTGIPVLIGCVLLCCTLQYSAMFAESIPINLLASFIGNLFLSQVCFSASFKKKLIHVIFLTVLMYLCEVLVLYSLPVIFKIRMYATVKKEEIMFLNVAQSKILSFIIAFLASNASKKKYPEKIVRGLSTLLFVLPLTSFFIITSFVYVLSTVAVKKSVTMLFMIITLVLMFSNIAIFLIHEKVVSALKHDAELSLENQRAKINLDYYNEIENQYAQSAALIHDINKHLSVVGSLADENKNTEISEYVNSVVKNYDVNSLRRFSDNKIVDVIINKYYHLCQNNNISFQADIRHVNFENINDSDLTTLIDNALENAYEASVDAERKEIETVIDNINDSFVLIVVTNYCGQEPKRNSSGGFVSSKMESGVHGVGTKNMNRTAKKYGGRIKYKFDRENMLFRTEIILKTK